MQNSAHNDANVVRVFKFNSHSGVSKVSEEVKKGNTDIGLAWIQDALRDLNEHHVAQTNLSAQQLALAEACERREAEKMDEEHKLKLWKQYEDWVDSPQLLLRKKAEKLGRELEEEEGFSMD